MNRRGVVVIGAGGHGKVVVRGLLEAGHEVAEIWDGDEAKWGQHLWGIPIRGPIEELAAGPQRPAVLAIGNNRARQRLARELRMDWVTLIHPRAWLDPTVRPGEGSVVFAGVMVQPDARIGAHAILNTGSTVDHDSVLGDFVHVAPGVHLAGHVTLGEGAFLGIGCSAIVGIHVGAWATVGAGAAVIRDIPPGVTAVGVPARVLERGVLP